MPVSEDGACCHDVGPHRADRDRARPAGRGTAGAMRRQARHRRIRTAAGTAPEPELTGVAVDPDQLALAVHSAVGYHGAALRRPLPRVSSPGTARVAPASNPPWTGLYECQFRGTGS